eukprot:6171828-Pleurochrysis_carterae.AAC.2
MYSIYTATSPPCFCRIVFCVRCSFFTSVCAGTLLRNTRPLPPPIDITSGTGLPAAFRAAVIPRGPPMLASTVSDALPNYLAVVIPLMQKRLWHACRSLHANRSGAAKRLDVMQPLPTDIGIEIINWFAQRFPGAPQAGGVVGKAVVERRGTKVMHSVLLSPKQARDLCSFEFVAPEGFGSGHMLILSAKGDVRFVRAIVVRFVHSVGQNARHCVERLELLVATWELNGLTGALVTGPQLPYTPAQWAQCVGEAKRTLHEWHPESRERYLSRNLIRWISLRLLLPPAQCGMGARRLMANHLA